MPSTSSLLKIYVFLGGRAVCGTKGCFCKQNFQFPFLIEPNVTIAIPGQGSAMLERLTVQIDLVTSSKFSPWRKKKIKKPLKIQCEHSWFFCELQCLVEEGWHLATLFFLKRLGVACLRRPLLQCKQYCLMHCHPLLFVQCLESPVGKRKRSMTVSTSQDPSFSGLNQV